MAGGTNNPGGGWTSYNIIDYVTIASAANAVDFGDIAAGASSQPGSNGAASPTRGVFASGSQQADISMITIASAGNTTDWGDMNMGNATVGSDSNAIRVIYAGAYNSTKIKYSTIATNGDAVDFGDTTVKKYIPAVAASSTRCAIAGGKQQPSPNAMENGIEYVQIMSEGNSVPVGPTEYRGGRGRGVFAGGIYGGGRTALMNYIEIATTGNSIGFGNLTQTASQGAALGSSVRGIAGGGTPSSPGGTTNIDYFIFSSKGGASDFGDFSEAGFEKGGASNNTRGLFFGSSVAPSPKNYIEYVTIATTGNASDFGDM